MPLTPQEWHTQFEVQANWTNAIRRYNFEQIIFSGTERILEVGSGTGVILNEVRKILDQSEKGFEEIRPVRFELYGIDINSRFEIEPGLKNTSALKVFFQKIRTNN